MAIEKINLPPEVHMVKQPDGTEKPEVRTPWEIRATGKDVQQLRGIFKESAKDMFHESLTEWQSIGETTITKPDGSTDVIRADKEHLYRSQPGFCQSRVRPGTVVSGFGGMKLRGITRYRAVYKGGVRTVLEER